MARRKRKVGAEGQQQKPARSPQEVLVKALNHPLRVKALTILSERIASPKEISKQLGEELARVSYHVRVLHQMGLIKIVEEETIRGALAHYYRAVDRPLIDNSGWQKLDPKVRNAVSGYVIETLMNDAANSLSAGVFDRREDRHLSRTPLRLDEEGWRKVCEIQAEADARILEAQVTAAERMNGSEGREIQVIAGMLCFEVLSSTES